MTTTLIHIDGADLLAELNEHGWTQGAWIDDDGAICAHQAIRRCSPQPGDAYLIEQIAERQGWGTGWNDAESTTEDDVRARLGAGVDVTDVDLADTFGPQWRAVVSLIRRAAVLTADEVHRLNAAGVAARGAVREAAYKAAESAARSAAWFAVMEAAWSATRYEAWDAARAVVTWDLATPDGPYTLARRDLLIRPWVEVCGLPADLLDEVTS